MSNSATDVTRARPIEGLARELSDSADAAESVRRTLVPQVEATVASVVRRVFRTSDPDYEDVLQNGVENVLVALRAGRFRGECPFGRWIQSIARHVVVDALRARARERRLFSYEEPDAALVQRRVGGPEHEAELRETVQSVQNALRKLGARKAEVVYLHDALGYDVAEVARVTGASVSAVQKRLARGRSQLRDRLRHSVPIRESGTRHSVSIRES